MPPTTPPSTAKKKSSGNKSLVPIIIGAVVLVIVIAAVVAIVANAGGGDDTDTTKRQFQGVVVEGEALPTLDDSGDLAFGTTAPTLKGANFDGAPVNVTPGDGQPYLLVFLAHWCPHCNAEVPVLNEWRDEGMMPEGLQVVGIATGSDQNKPNWPPSEWLEDKDWEWPVIADSPQAAAASAYGLDGYPFLVVVDGEGNVKLRTSGEKPLETLDAMVDDALASATPTDDPGGAASTEAPADTEAP